MMVGDYAGALANLGLPINRPNRAAKEDRLEVTKPKPEEPPPEVPPPPAKIDSSTDALATFNNELDTTNEGLSDAAEAGKSFVSTFLHDLKDGASFLDALGNAADRLNDRLLDMAIDQLFSAFGGVGAPMDIRPLPARAGGGRSTPSGPTSSASRGPSSSSPAAPAASSRTAASAARA